MENANRRDRVNYGDAVIEYEIRRSSRRRKTVEVKVEGGDVRVAAPAAATDDYLRRFVLSKAPWIMRTIHQSPPLQPETFPQRFADGAALPFLGRDYPMLTCAPDPLRPPVALDWETETFRIALPEGEFDRFAYQRVSRAVMDWYTEQAETYLAQRMDHWRPRCGVGWDSRMEVKNHRSQWGSCAPDGTLRFNWRLMMLPPEVVDMVVVHELSHLRVRNHSPDFWKVVEEHIPDYRALRKRLRELEKTLTL